MSAASVQIGILPVFQLQNSPEVSLGMSASPGVVPAFRAFRKVRKTFRSEQNLESCLPIPFPHPRHGAACLGIG